MKYISYLISIFTLDRYFFSCRGSNEQRQCDALDCVSSRCAMSKQQLREKKDILRLKGHTKHSRVRPHDYISFIHLETSQVHTLPQPFRIGAQARMYYLLRACKLRRCTVCCVNDTVANKLPPLPVLCGAVLIPYTLNYSRRHILFAKPETYDINT